MRMRTVAAFVLGLAAGVLGLAVALWSTGALRMSTIRITAHVIPPEQTNATAATGATTAQQPQPNIPLDLNGMVADAKNVQPPAPQNKLAVWHLDSAGVLHQDPDVGVGSFSMPAPSKELPSATVSQSMVTLLR